ncbi:MAG: hypothetical protein JXQ90_14765 [Cyclobacteriaceae bacterium]
MKRSVIFKFKLVAGMMMLAVLAQGAEVKKTINKSYKVSSSTYLEVDNRFGKVHVNNWDKSEFKIDIEIIVEGSNEDKAQKILDRIDIDISESSGGYSFKTDMDNLKTNNDDQFQVNYTISMPSENPVRMENSFGDLYLDTRDGSAYVKVSYGALKAADFNDEAEINVSFGKGDIGFWQRGKGTIKYSDVEIQRIGKIELNQQFSDVEIDELDEIELESKYGSVEIGSARSIDAEVQFSGFQIERLSKRLEMTASYVGDFEIEELNAEFESVYISGKFGSYEIGIPSDLKADFRGKFSFCNLKDGGVPIEYNYRVKDMNESEYRGKINGGDESKKIEVKSSYGDLKLFEY